MSFEKHHNCPLCNHMADYFCYIPNGGKAYYKCGGCRGIFLSHKNRVDLQTEKSRYKKHENDVEDSGYRQFVKPITDAVQLHFPKTARGLDYGCGTGPVASVVLESKGYAKLVQYDPIFQPNLQYLNFTYDYIICCEVMEHFFDPEKEFSKLKSLLKDSGKLYCKTEILSNDVSLKEFRAWWYKDDPTHVFFYTPATLAYIANQYHFDGLTVSPDLIIFS